MNLSTWTPEELQDLRTREIAWLLSKGYTEFSHRDSAYGHRGWTNQRLWRWPPVQLLKSTWYVVESYIAGPDLEIFDSDVFSCLRNYFDLSDSRKWKREYAVQCSIALAKTLNDQRLTQLLDDTESRLKAARADVRKYTRDQAHWSWLDASKTLVREYTRDRNTLRDELQSRGLK